MSGFWRRVALAASIVGVPAAGVAAEPNDFDIQRFRPAMDSQGFVTVERSKALGTLDPSFGLYLDYAFSPLVQTIDGKERELVTSYGTGRFVGAIGFASLVEVGIQIPMVIVRGDPDGPGEAPELSGDGLGDISAHLKVRILDREVMPVGLAIVAAAGFDTGEPDIFATHAQSPVLSGKLVVDWDIGQRVGMALNAGALIREKREITGNVVIPATDATPARTVAREDPIIAGSEISFGLGIGFAAIKGRLDLIAELYGAAPLESGAERAMPMEALLGLKLFLVGNSFFSFGVTRGILGDYGDPTVRPFAGIIFEPAVGDRDGDGIEDDIDRCPDQPEDKDGFEDEDGCPDPDNDQDGIPDLVDQCPDIAEDFNGYEDEDGCPEAERDRDRDGILDSVDRCPDDPEDKDGFEDEDGCPELDNDRDGVPDSEDQCPMEPEDIDGFKDEDGCPDPDNDQDGIPDDRDQCPNEPENFNGVEDGDGCPESEKKVVIAGGKIRILDKVFFETNKAIIKAESYDILYQVAETLRQNPGITKVEVQGHTDSRGRDDYNLDLSDRRAAAVRVFLIDRGGIAGDRLVSKGYGETEPIVNEENADAWAQNRRVEFVILEEKGTEPGPFDQ
ncbi:MAG: OmpA family protein [Myxococcales bacterium]|nr:OmpA family protein [Myxococcales bacterium]